MHITEARSPQHFICKLNAPHGAKSGAVLAQTFEALKGTGLDEQSMAHLLMTVLKMDEKDAKMYAKSLAKAKAEDAAAAAGGGFGGGGGPFGGDPGGEPVVAPGGAADGE